MWGGGKKDKRQLIQEVTMSLRAAGVGNLQGLCNLQHGKLQSLYRAGRGAEGNKDYCCEMFCRAGPWGNWNISCLCKTRTVSWFLWQNGLSKNLSKQEGTESKWSSSLSCFLTEGSSWQKKDHEDTRHQASTFNSHELTTWSCKTREKETLCKLSSSHNYTEDHTQHEGESRWVSQESEVLDTHSCWGIWSLAWPDQPKDSIHLYPSTLLNLGLLWNGAQFPAITSDCFTVPKGVRTSFRSQALSGVIPC